MGKKKGEIPTIISLKSSPSHKFDVSALHGKGLNHHD
jgi:hypothetical protein